MNKELTIVENNKKLLRFSVDTRKIKNGITLSVSINNNYHTRQALNPNRYMNNFYYLTIVLFKIKITFSMSLGNFK